MKSYRLHLIRCGLTKENLEGRYLGHTDVSLCERGVAEIEQLKKELTYPEVEGVFSSPLRRCLETAKLIYPEKEPIAMRELIEFDFGEFENKTAEELEKHPLFADWLAGKPGTEAPFGDTNEGFGRRISAGFERIVDAMITSGVQDVAAVTHGGVIMHLMERYAIPEASAHEWLTPPGCGYTLLITPQLWTAGKKVEATAEIPEPEHDFEYEKSLWGQ